MNSEAANKNELSKEQRRELQINFWGSLALTIFAIAFIFFSTKIR